MAFEDRKKIYTEHLDALSEFPVWTIDQIKEFLHLDFDTVQKFVAAKWLYKFNVGRCTFYSCNNKKFTNQAIIKSVIVECWTNSLSETRARIEQRHDAI